MFTYLRHAAYRERKLTTVPTPVRGLVVLAICLQIFWHHQQAAPLASAKSLDSPPSQQSLQAISLGEPLLLAKYLNLWLQAFDNQPGISLSFRELDYATVIQWLTSILHLDPRGQYPLLAASRLYADIPVPEKQRQMLDFVYQVFFADPNRRWPWLAHAAYIAKHRLDDLPLALGYARAIAEHTDSKKVPAWARQMEIYILEDMGEVESARVLIGGLLESGTIKDPHELWFLTNRLKELEEGQQGAQGKRAQTEL